MIGVIVSDSSIVSRALERSLESSFQSVRRFARLAEMDTDLDWDNVVIVYDLKRPAEDIEAVLQFKSKAAPARMIVLTKETHDLRHFAALVGHVSAILPSSSDLEDVALVARLVRSGLVLLPPEMIPYLQMPKVSVSVNAAAISSLTERETGVLALIAQGSSNKVIARKLGINDTTVRVHVRSVLRKIGVNNRTQAALWVMQSGHESSDLGPIAASSGGEVAGRESSQWRSQSRRKHLAARKAFAAVLESLKEARAAEENASDKSDILIPGQRSG